MFSLRVLVYFEFFNNYMAQEADIERQPPYEPHGHWSKTAIHRLTSRFESCLHKREEENMPFRKRVFYVALRRQNPIGNLSIKKAVKWHITKKLNVGIDFGFVFLYIRKK